MQYIHTYILNYMHVISTCVLGQSLQLLLSRPHKTMPVFWWYNLTSPQGIWRTLVSRRTLNYLPTEETTVKWSYLDHRILTSSGFGSIWYLQNWRIGERGYNLKECGKLKMVLRSSNPCFWAISLPSSQQEFVDLITMVLCWRGCLAQLRA